MLQPQQILFEDNHLLVVNKPAGLLSQGDDTNDLCLVDLAKEYIRVKYQKPGNIFCGLVHRLDRPVSGVILLAKTSKALERLTAQFRDRKVQKNYAAVVHGIPKDERKTLVHYLKKDTQKNKVTAYNNQKPDTQFAELSYELAATNKAYSLLKVMPHTGRSHQIRVQLSSNGTPIVGDLKYGSKETNEDASICLHAYELHFTHPTLQTQLVFTAPLPIIGQWKNFKINQL